MVLTWARVGILASGVGGCSHLGKLWLVKTGGVITGEKCPFLVMCGLVVSAFLLVFIARR